MSKRSNWWKGHIGYTNIFIRGINYTAGGGKGGSLTFEESVNGGAGGIIIAPDSTLYYTYSSSGNQTLSYSGFIGGNNPMCTNYGYGGNGGNATTTPGKKGDNGIIIITSYS